MNALLAAALLSAPAPQAPPVFRAEVDVVRVEVLVTRKGTPVRGLAAADFEVRDEGRLQVLEPVLEEETPVDAILVLDMSGSVNGPKLEALKAAGREDPDLILVGEMRDLETISMALSAAEKGTIVFGTLHTNNASKTVDRMISVFPASEQEGIRNVLGETLRAVVAQQLIPKIGGGRVAAIEILFSSPAIGNMIREGKTPMITSAIQTGVKEGMIDMDSSIRKLYDEKQITARAAIDKAIDKSQFKDLIEGGAG